MKKKINSIQLEYEMLMKGKTEIEREAIEKTIIIAYKEKLENDNKDFIEQKMKNYEKFKKMKAIDANPKGINQIKQLLGFRTHSKKNKKKGRKRRFSNNALPLNEQKYNYEDSKLKELFDFRNNNYSGELKDMNKGNNNETHLSAFKNYSIIQTPKKEMIDSTIDDSYKKIFHLSSSIKKPIQIITGDFDYNQMLTPIKGIGVTLSNVQLSDIFNTSNINENNAKKGNQI